MSSILEAAQKAKEAANKYMGNPANTTYTQVNPSTNNGSSYQPNYSQYQQTQQAPTQQQSTQQQPTQQQPTQQPQQQASINKNDGGFSYMWKNGQLHSVNNTSLDKYRADGYELDSGQLAKLEAGTPVQGYGTLQGLPQGMTDNDYFQQYMGMTADQYYMSQATNKPATQTPDYSAYVGGNTSTAPVTPTAPIQPIIPAQPIVPTQPSINNGEIYYTPGNSSGVQGYTENQLVNNDFFDRYLRSLLQGGFN